jgi:hypothetical protein
MSFARTSFCEKAGTDAKRVKMNNKIFIGADWETIKNKK